MTCIRNEKKTSVADPGCLSRIAIQIFSIPAGSQIQGQKDSGSRIRIKELKYFKPKKLFQALGNMIRDVQPGSGSRLFLPIPDPGVRKAPDPGSGFRIRNTEKNYRTAYFILRLCVNV